MLSIQAAKKAALQTALAEFTSKYIISIILPIVNPREMLIDFSTQLITALKMNEYYDEDDDVKRYNIDSVYGDISIYGCGIHTKISCRNFSSFELGKKFKIIEIKHIETGPDDIFTTTLTNEMGKKGTIFCVNIFHEKDTYNICFPIEDEKTIETLDATELIRMLSLATSCEKALEYLFL
jgi:hypothetical protein